jgi:hypothetical protein
VVGFTLFGWYLHRVADDPTAVRAQATAALLGAFVQATFEALAVVVFASGTNPVGPVLSIAGNTLTHGVVLGAIPLVVLYPWLEPYVRRKKPTGAD